MKRVLLISLILEVVVFSSSCRTVSIRGGLSYDGRSVGEITTVEPEFAITDKDSGMRLHPEILYQKGKYKVYNLPAGKYLINVEIDANMTNSFNYPGDLRGGIEFSTDRDALHADIELARIIHLTAPQDNSMKLSLFGVDCNLEAPFLASPVIFKWEPLGGGTEYLYQVTRRRTDSKDTGERIAEGTTLKNETLLSLPSNEEDEYYLFYLTARKGGHVMGLLMTQNLCYIDANYHFRVRGPR